MNKKKISRKLDKSSVAGSSTGGGPTKHKYEDLKERGKRLKGYMKWSDTGPLIIAQEIMLVFMYWDVKNKQTGTTYRDEAKGLECTEWLKSVFGNRRGYSWWARRARGVEVCGEACRRYMHHEVAAYIADNIDEDKVEVVCTMLMQEYRDNENNPIGYQPATTRMRKMGILKEQKEKRKCKRCQYFMVILDEHGIKY